MGKGETGLVGTVRGEHLTLECLPPQERWEEVAREVMTYSRRRDTSGEDLMTAGPPSTGFASHVETVLVLTKDPDPSFEKHAVAVAIISREGNGKVIFVRGSHRWQTGEQVTAEQHMFYHEDGICEISGIVDGIPNIGWSRHIPYTNPPKYHPFISINDHKDDY
ncbi:unnamed protein product [Clonostachys rosea f. rosea IK726]|uniref:Uncharacterized protein n=1 Tax=Clonostachys rosea f. rosea IK726 TaxID=1349383 RepID=A0ACA9UGK9_BIOOC|nr:unnamed protein product [Clonostachys rosea f. rosea IK726]